MMNRYLRGGLTLGALLTLATLAAAQSSETIQNAALPGWTASWKAWGPSTPPSVWLAPAAVLLDSGPLITHPGGGAGGLDACRLQSTSLGMSTLGFGHQIVNTISVADDFTVPVQWGLTQITFFAYQTGSTTTSTINEVRVQIWDGPPNGGGTVIFGDLTTNRLASTSFSNIYRETETTVGATTRPIMAVVATVATTLAPATYWVEWQMAGTLASGPWAPPITINGQATTGNGLQNLAGTWAAALDGGTGAPPQGFKFIIEGVSDLIFKDGFGA